jgi:hypothetical protein
MREPSRDAGVGRRNSPEGRRRPMKGILAWLIGIPIPIIIILYLLHVF